MKTDWEKLKDRREKHKLVQFYKMTKKLTPHYISCLVPQAFANIHDYNTRNASALPVVRTRTSLYYNSFIPSSVRLWNLQPDNIRLSPSIHSSLEVFSKIKYFFKAILLLYWTSPWANSPFQITNAVFLFKPPFIP